MSSRLITPPSEEPVTLAEAKLHLRMTDDDDDSEVAGLIAQARDWCEQFCERAFVTQTRLLVLDAFPDSILLDMPPLIGVDSIKYLDATTGAQTTLSSASYVVDTYSPEPWVQPAYGYSWPATYAEINAVQVQYRCGYGVAADVPASIKAAIKLLLGNMDAVREDTVVGTQPPGSIPLGVKALLAPYRYGTGIG